MSKTDKPMAPEERAWTEKWPPTSGVPHGYILCFAPDLGVATYDPSKYLEPLRILAGDLNIAFAKLYADGQRDGARAENEACEKLARPMVYPGTGIDTYVIHADGIADAIAARREGEA